MFFKKFTIGLALSSVMVSGFAQTANLSNANTKINQSEMTSKVKTVGDYNPFNQNTFVHSYANQDGDLYAYYAGDVFPGQWGTPRYGYELRMSNISMHYLIWSYDAAVQEKKNANGGMISYLIGNVSTIIPYTGGWVYYSQYNKDVSAEDSFVFAISFKNGPLARDIVQDALNNNQTITFFLELQFDRGAVHDHYGRVIVANIDTGQTVTSNWFND